MIGVSKVLALYKKFLFNTSVEIVNTDNSWNGLTKWLSHCADFSGGHYELSTTALPSGTPMLGFEP